jgi:hypothetical protein
VIGGGVAVIGGVNRLPPLGLIDFSVGSTDGAVVEVVVVVVMVVVLVVDGVVSGAFWPSPHAAVKETIATIATPPTASEN